MNEYTPEKVAELVDHARSGNYLATRPGLVRDMADALTAVSAERDEARETLAVADWQFTKLKEQTGSADAERIDLRAERDRLHKAITEALEHIDHTIHVIDDEDGEPRMDDEADAYTEGATTAQHAIGVILRAALDREGNDDE